MGLEIIQTHNVMTTLPNKRLHQEVEDNEDLPSSQESELDSNTNVKKLGGVFKHPIFFFSCQGNINQTQI